MPHKLAMQFNSSLIIMTIIIVRDQQEGVSCRVYQYAELISRLIQQG